MLLEHSTMLLPLPGVPHLHGSFYATGGDVPAIWRPCDRLHRRDVLIVREDMLSSEAIRDIDIVAYRSNVSAIG